MDTILPYALLCLPLFYVDKPFGYNAGLFDNDEWFGRKRATTYCEKSYNHFFLLY